MIVSVCTVCGKKYSKWTTPVSARDVCSECFEVQLGTERKNEPPADTVPSTVTAAPPLETDAESSAKRTDIPPRAPIEILVETLGVTLALFGARLLFDWLEPQSKFTVTAHGLVANSLTYCGWILLVISLLNHAARFQWRLPDSKTAWREEFEWAALLLLIGFAVKAIVLAMGRDLHLRSDPSVWHEALRNHNTWIAYQIVVPISAIYQELVYRVYMQFRLTQILRGRPVVVVLMGSWLFAAMHGYAPLQSLGVFVVGVVYGASYQLNGKIPRLVIAHTANNIFAGFF